MNKYEKCLHLAKEQGLYLDDRIERREKKGLFGMYATKKIPKGTLIASFPKAALLPENTEISDNHEVRWSYAIAKELQKGEDSAYRAHTMMLEEIDELKQHSLYYFSQEEIQLLFDMNPLLGNEINNYSYRVDKILEAIKDIDPTLDEALAIKAILNHLSRSWGEYGLLPVLDLFNHSERKGVQLQQVNEGSHIGFVLDSDYEPDQQIWISYGQKDIFLHATSYNYFDPNNEHIIDYALRAIQVLDTPEKTDVANFICKNFDARIFEYNGQKKLALNEPKLYILENGPNEKLYNYLRKVSFTTLEELRSKKCSPLSTALTYLSVINAFLSANRVDQFKITNVPSKLQRFHQALKKEKKILLSNKTWAELEVNRIKSKAK